MGGLLEASDLPEGTLTVRVARGSLTDPVVGGEVVLEVGGKRRTARTDDHGRARFDGLPAGASLIASFGESRSDPVTMPAGVGARMLLFAPPAPGAVSEALPSAPPSAMPPPAGMPGMPGMPDPSAMSGIPVQSSFSCTQIRVLASH